MMIRISGDMAVTRDLASKKLFLQLRIAPIQGRPAEWEFVRAVLEGARIKVETIASEGGQADGIDLRLSVPRRDADADE